MASKMQVSDNETFEKLSAEIAKLYTSPAQEAVLPSLAVLEDARSKLYTDLPEDGAGLEEAIRHIQEELAPGFNASSRSPN